MQHPINVSISGREPLSIQPLFALKHMNLLIISFHGFLVASRSLQIDHTQCRVRCLKILCEDAAPQSRTSREESKRDG